MSFSHEYNFPIFVSTGKVLTSGDTSQLAKGQIGVFDGKTYKAASGLLNPNQPLFLAQGSYATQDKLGNFVGGLTQSDKTIQFLAKDILSFERSKPLKAQAEQWILGWDGTNNCGSFSFETGKTYRFLIKVWGEDVYGTFLRPLLREVQVSFPPTADGVPVAVGTKYGAQKIAEAINSDPELKYFINAEAIHSDYAATTATHESYDLTIADDGSAAALAAVQATITGGKLVSRIDRKGILSTYRFFQPVADAAPANFTPTSDIKLADCGSCPGGYTLVGAKDVIIVQRALSASDDLNSVSDQNTFATAVGTAYGTALSVTVTGATYISHDAAVAKVAIKVPAGTVVTPILSDVVSKANTTDAVCTPPAGASVAWVAGPTMYKKTKEYCITLPKICGSSDRLAELTAFYAGNTKISTAIAVKTAGTCSDTYSVSVYSDNLLEDACLSEDVPVFSPIQSYEGFVWSECPCTTEDTGDSTVKAGVRITTAYESSSFGGCSFSPADYYSVRPLKLEVTELVHGPGVDNNGTVPVNPIPSRKSRNARMSTQSGEWLIREKIKADRYKLHGEFYYDPRLREVLSGGSSHLDIVDRDKNYVAYFLKVRQDRKGQNHEGDFNPEIYEFMIAVPEGTDASTLETTIGAVAAQAGVFLKDR